ncbi:MAG TPA: response regulator [Thermodesulfovibrionales bacterium]|nr:response regulator [Thermodesulfovibrionales bacterium]
MNQDITYRILIFDDDAFIRDVLWRIFNKRGFEVFTFPHPRSCPICEVLACTCALNEACADLIITDLNMPFMRGLDFLEQQKSKGCKVKNLALMAAALQEEDRARATELGIRVFEKPFQLADIKKWAAEAEAKISPRRGLTNWHLGHR